MQLGVQSPEVYTAGDTLHYSLLLWSKSIPALEALTGPDGDIDAVFASSEIFGSGVLYPRSGEWRNRNTKRLAQGRVWHTDDGPPDNDEMPELREGPTIVKVKAPKAKGEDAQDDEPVKSKKEPPRSRLKDVISAKDIITIEEGDEEDGELDNDDAQSPRSPSPDFDDESTLSPDEEHLEGTIRIDGDVRIPGGLLPSFRYKWMG